MRKKTLRGIGSPEAPARPRDPPHLVLLHAAHHVDEQVDAALVHDGQALQQRYLVWRGGEGRRETEGERE